jgi:predicted anti-sigma-YlaC factor YlaD
MSVVFNQMNGNNMSCHAVNEQFDERLDGRLDVAQQAALAAHLAGCADCRREWEAYARAWQTLERDKGIEPSFGFVERTLRRLNEPQAAGLARFWHPSFRWTALATTVVVLAVGAWVGHERMIGQMRVEVYARAQQADYLEDFDVIANLDQLKGDNHL